MATISEKLKKNKESAAALEYFIVACAKNHQSRLPSDEQHGFMAATRTAFALHKGLTRATLRLAAHLAAMYSESSESKSSRMAHAAAFGYKLETDDEHIAHCLCAIVSDGSRDDDKWRSRGNFWVQCGDFEYEQFLEILKGKK